jgi:hypothetical protein
MKAALAATLLASLSGLLSEAEPVYFVVGNPPGFGPGTNAYILPLTRPTDITKARVLVVTGGTEGSLDGADGDPWPAVVIGLGSDGINRNVALPGEPLWSWHVTDLFIWFGASLPEDPYKHPWQLEEAVRNGTIPDGAHMGFLGYTVVAEVDPPLALYSHKDMWGTLYLYWTHNAPNTVYTVEWTRTLSPPAWQPLSYDMSGVQFLPPGLVGISQTAIDGGFFRLRTAPKPAAP